MQVGDPPVGGRYSLVEPYGADERFAGGKVQTWRARDTLAERDVILRVISPGGNSSRLFLDRALEMSMIAHPGLGAVYEAVDHGEFGIVVCEWIDGTSLADTLTAHGPLNPNTARQTIGDVAEAIAVAHHAGLPIGGITAERVVLRDNASVTVAAVPALFADERGDIQQLGVLLYAALTGDPPDLSDPDLARHLHRSVPRDLAVLCQRALDHDPARQLGSAAAFAAVLRPRSRPQSPTAATAGRTGERLGGTEPEPPPVAHDTAPARLPQAAKPRSSAAPAAAPTAAPRTVAIPVVTSQPEVATDPLRPAVGPAGPAARSDAEPDGPTTTRIPLGGTAASAPRSEPITEPAPFRRPAPDGSSASAPEATSAPTAEPTAAAVASAATPSAARRRDLPDEEDIPERRPSSHAAIDPRGSPINYGADDDYDPWLDDTGTWGSYDDEDDPETESRHEGSQTRRKVLLYAVPLVALLLVVALGIFVGKQFSAVVNDGDDSPPVPGAESTATVTSPAEGEATETTEGAPEAPAPLAPVSAAVYDPFGDGASENGEDVGLSYDGDVASAWTTLTYQNTPEFGNLKPGVGLIFDLGEERTVTSIELATNLPGSAIEIRIGAAPDAPLESYPVVGTLDPFSDTGSVALAEPVRARFVIVWFVRLVESNGGFQGALAECRILGT